MTGRKYVFLRKKARVDKFGNVLSNSVLQSLEGMVNIPTVAGAYELINYVDFFVKPAVCPC